MSFPLQSAFNERWQMGVDNAGHTGIAGFRFPTLNSDFMPAADPSIQTRHAGGKEVGGVIGGDRWVAGPLGGGNTNQNIIDYNELAFLAAGNWDNPTAVLSDTAAWTRVFEVNPDDVDNTAIFKAQSGTTGNVLSYTDVVIPNFGLTFIRRGASTVQGAFLGKQITPGGTFDAATGIVQKSLASVNTGLYFPTTFGGTLTGQRADPYGFNVEFHQNNKFGPGFVLDDSVIGPLGFKEGQIDKGGQVGIGYAINSADLAGKFNFAAWDEGDQIFFTVYNVSKGLIPGAATTHFSVRLDVAAEISGPPTKQRVDNFLVWVWPYVCTQDPVSGVSARLTLVDAVPNSYTAVPA